MKSPKLLIACVLFLSHLSLGSGCATLPDVGKVIDAAPAARPPRPVVSSNGPISPQKSEAIMNRLKRSVPPTEMLERYTAILESVTDSPLTKGNRVTLLADGQATYAAMFQALEKARDHINLESYIFEDDQTGRKFASLLLRKRSEGVRVHVIYDSMGSIDTAESFFQQLRDGGIEVV